MTRRAVRTDRTRAAALLWGGWLLVTAGVFSYVGQGPSSFGGGSGSPAIATW